MADYRRAAAQRAGRPVSRVGFAFILLVWSVGASALAWALIADRLH
jgi:hypothetical protein